MSHGIRCCATSCDEPGAYDGDPPVRLRRSIALQLKRELTDPDRRLLVGTRESRLRFVVGSDGGFPARFRSTVRAVPPASSCDQARAPHAGARAARAQLGFRTPDQVEVGPHIPPTTPPVRTRRRWSCHFRHPSIPPAVLRLPVGRLPDASQISNVRVRRPRCGQARPWALRRGITSRGGCRPTEIVHVGDGASNVYGARSAGCRTVLVHRGGPRPVHVHDADAVIPGSPSLPALTEAWT